MKSQGSKANYAVRKKYVEAAKITFYKKIPLT